MRVVRFTDVDPDNLEKRLGEMDASEGPPEGVRSSGIQILVDRDQRTAIVLQHFDSEQDMRDSEAALDAMDPAETPGTRQSVDRCEMALELKA